MSTKTKPKKTTKKPRVRNAEKPARDVVPVPSEGPADVRVCNRCSVVRSPAVGICENCGSPEFSCVPLVNGSPAPSPLVAAGPTKADQLMLSLSREMVEHTDRLDKLQQDWDAKKTAALEAKHALKAEQDTGNELAREMRTVQRTGRSDRQPTLPFDREAAAVPEPVPDTPLNGNVNDHPIGQIGIDLPWIESLEEKHKVKTIGDLRQRIASGRFSLDKATGFAAAARKEVFSKLETYLQEHGVEAFPDDAGEESQDVPVDEAEFNAACGERVGTTFDGEVE